MALEIKAIPTLKGKEAERFVKEADKAYQKKEKTQAGENSPCYIEKSQYVVSMGLLLDKCSFSP